MGSVLCRDNLEGNAYKKREVRHSSRSTRASQSPNKVEKQPNSTPDMLNPPRQIAGRGMYNIPTGHSSCCLDFILKNVAKILSSRKQRQ